MSLAQGTEGSLDGFLTKNGRSMQARLEGIPLYSWVDGCLLAKNPVIMQPSTTLVSDCFLEDKMGICQHMPCPSVGSPHFHNVRKQLIQDWMVWISLNLVFDGRGGCVLADRMAPVTASICC